MHMEQKYFLLALKEAKKAFKKGEIPVGAVVVKNGKIIAKGHNNRQIRCNPLGHAEVNCIVKTAKYNHDWRLDNNYEMYVTLEPCKMCTSIIEECRIGRVHYLLKQKNTTKGSNYLQTKVCDDIKKEYEILLKNFFTKLRK